MAAISMILLCAVWSCATANNDEETVRSTEARLDDAGFTKIDVDVPSEELGSLPAFTLNQYQSVSGLVFWYYDPDYCQCLYEGNQAAADRYSMSIQQEKDIADYESEYETEQAATQQALMANSFGGMVPMPFFYGGFASWYGYGGGYYGGGGGHHYRSPPPGGGHSPGGGRHGHPGGGGRPGGGHHGHH